MTRTNIMAKAKYDRIYTKKHPNKDRTIEIIGEDKAYIIVCRKKFVKLLNLWQQGNYDYKKHCSLFYLQEGSAFRECHKWNKFFETDAFQVLEVSLESEGKIVSKKIDFEIVHKAKPIYQRKD